MGLPQFHEELSGHSLWSDTADPRTYLSRSTRARAAENKPSSPEAGCVKIDEATSTSKQRRVGVLSMRKPHLFAQGLEDLADNEQTRGEHQGVAPSQATHAPTGEGARAHHAQNQHAQRQAVNGVRACASHAGRGEEAEWHVDRRRRGGARSGLSTGRGRIPSFSLKTHKHYSRGGKGEIRRCQHPLSSTSHESTRHPPEPQTRQHTSAQFDE